MAELPGVPSFLTLLVGLRISEACSVSTCEMNCKRSVSALGGIDECLATVTGCQTDKRAQLVALVQTPSLS